MKKIFVLILFCSVCMNAQNFRLVKEKSYLSSDEYTLHSNSDSFKYGDLKIAFTEEDNDPHIILSSKTIIKSSIRKKVLILLDNGTVIICEGGDIYEYVNETAVAVYKLSNDDVKKLKESNINTIKYNLLLCSGCEVTKLSASNKNIDFTEIVKKFYE